MAGNRINIIELAKSLPTRRRGNACVVLTHEYPEQKAWAQKLAEKADADHIDLLDFFSENENLYKDLSEFSVSSLFEFLKTITTESILIISGMEFLIATWVAQPNSTEQFASHLETWNSKPSLLFVTQHEKDLATRVFRRFRQYKFIVDQRETLVL